MKYVQSKWYRHQKDVNDVFWYLYCELWTSFTTFSSVSITDLEQLNVCWDWTNTYSKSRKSHWSNVNRNVVPMLFILSTFGKFLPIFTRKKLTLWCLVFTKWSNTRWKSCSKCCNIFNVCLTIFRSFLSIMVIRLVWLKVWKWILVFSVTSRIMTETIRK